MRKGYISRKIAGILTDKEIFTYEYKCTRDITEMLTSYFDDKPKSWVPVTKEEIVLSKIWDVYFCECEET